MIWIVCFVNLVNFFEGYIVYIRASCGEFAALSKFNYGWVWFFVVCFGWVFVVGDGWYLIGYVWLVCFVWIWVWVFVVCCWISNIREGRLVKVLFLSYRISKTLMYVCLWWCLVEFWSWCFLYGSLCIEWVVKWEWEIFGGVNVEEWSLLLLRVVFFVVSNNFVFTNVFVFW